MADDDTTQFQEALARERELWEKEREAERRQRRAGEERVWELERQVDRMMTEIAFRDGERTGWEKGVKEGILLARRADVCALLKARFDPLPEEVIERINKVTDQQHLLRLARQSFEIQSLGELEL